MVLVPLRVAIFQEHEDGEEDIDPELEDLKVGSSHCGCRSRGTPFQVPLTAQKIGPAQFVAYL